MEKITETTTGAVTLKLYKGSLSVASRMSPYSLYRQYISSFEEGSGIYNQAELLESWKQFVQSESMSRNCEE